MDFIIEIIVEVFGEILVEGINFLATSDKIPKFIRIAVMIIISAALLIVVCVSFTFVFRSPETGLKIASGIIGLFALFFLIYFQICWWKAINTK